MEPNIFVGNLRIRLKNGTNFNFFVAFMDPRDRADWLRITAAEIREQINPTSMEREEMDCTLPMRPLKEYTFKPTSAEDLENIRVLVGQLKGHLAQQP